MPESGLYQLMVVAKRRPEAKLPDDSCAARRPTTVDGHLAALWRTRPTLPMPGDDVTTSVFQGPGPPITPAPAMWRTPKCPTSN